MTSETLSKIRDIIPRSAFHLCLAKLNELGCRRHISFSFRSSNCACWNSPRSSNRRYVRWKFLPSSQSMSSGPLGGRETGRREPCRFPPDVFYPWQNTEGRRQLEQSQRHQYLKERLLSGSFRRQDRAKWCNRRGGTDLGNMHCFEALGTGSLLLSDADNYPDGQSIVTCNSSEQTVAKIGLFSVIPRKDLEIARAGHEMITTRFSKEMQ
jgi:spore maturation protein CgeB